MKLDVLCEGIVEIQGGFEGMPDVCHITHDSRKVEAGSLFVAIQGEVYDGNNFIAHACQLGAVAVLTTVPERVPCSLPILSCKEPRRVMALLSRKLYGFPDRELETIGVTGTNGKTTTAFILDQLLSVKGLAGRIGTLSNYTGVSEELSIRATPESSEVYQLLREMVTQNCMYAAMEISSHALMMSRVWGLTLRYAIFTNLTHDHLDYHENMDAYFEAKKRIFKLLAPKGIALVNGDDSYCRKIELKDHKLMTFGVGEDVDLRFKILELAGEGSRAEFIMGEERQECWIPLIGKHNLYNFAAAALVARLEGISWFDIAKRGCSLKPVPGRMESLVLGQPFDVAIDFAHSPDALENVLKSCRTITDGKVHVVFGAGGNRDNEKRPLMGIAVANNADYLYVTSDNPRTEDPTSIIEEVISEIQDACQSGRCRINLDRRESIRDAFNRAHAGDLILIAGKGHETVQDLNGILYPFNDRDVSSQIIKEGGLNGPF